KRESLARSGNGRANRVGVNFATRSSNQLVAELGAQTNAGANGNAITSGVLLGLPPSGVQNIDASDLVAQPSGAIAKLITSTHATAQVTGQGAIIT
ncbi:MAG: hypothetical protein EBV40_06675, partial [Actinobacteria bacterium]|nr:hypothetical protein [Actinomycetota bacterium]